MKDKTRNSGILTAPIRVSLLIALAMVMMIGCGKVKQASQTAKYVVDMAKAGEKMARAVTTDDAGAIDWKCRARRRGRPDVGRASSRAYHQTSGPNRKGRGAVIG